MERTPDAKGCGSPSVPATGEAVISICAVLIDDLDRIDQFLTDTSQLLSARFRYYELLLIDNALDRPASSRVEDWQHRIPNIRLLRLSRHYSHEIALAAALDNSIGDYVVVMNIATDPPSMIPQLITTAISGFDVVIAERSANNDPPIRKFLSQVFCRIASILLGYQLQPNATYFRAFSRRAVNSLIRIRSKNRYLRCLNGMVGFSQASIPHIGFSSRSRGPSRLIASAGSAADIIISNSAAPLRLASLLGLIASSANVLYFGYILVVTLVKRKLAEGWLTISITSTTMFFLLFIILSILSEYVARILDESKDQPLYFIETETNSDVSSFQHDRLNVK